MDTLGSLRSEILGWMRGDYSAAQDIPLVNAAINDAIEAIWTAMIQVQLARFLGLDSPVTFTLNAGQERVQLVSQPDPTVAPAVDSVAGGTLGARTYLVGFTYVTESGSETQLSPTTAQAIAANALASVVAPASPGTGSTWGTGVIGWNLYASVSNTPGLMALQNQQPLPFGVPYNETPVGWLDYPGNQQQAGATPAQPVGGPTTAALGIPSENTTADNIAWISHLEVRTSDTLLRSWNQYSINSELFRRYGRELSSASEYQTYVWDLINGNRLEIRPSAGLAFEPRYFYIAKPRRLRYDQAAIPFGNITGTHEYLVDAAVSKLKLGVDEYLAQQQWDAKAQAIKAGIIGALTQELWAKNDRVTPHLF